ncbi:hypothetical protein CDD80_2099 [Ophiocordyceps camponoti-rufipedis]|uniref:Peptidase M24 domain-containing protein n=1 Tax=Ophiocordyceps camponoti-rufipedis TaxID=2004952 RepID=A0A2C5ZNX4_9HYPO|nr:hypothetical protein CDD80_2099 [Ophiocordyceps camponoti-rufipedis]
MWLTSSAQSYPSPLNYNHFPKSCCTSVNEVICHGIPDKRPLVDGDILNIDISLYHEGYHADLNETYYIGEKAAKDPENVRVVEAARQCLEAAIQAVKPGVPILGECKPGMTFTIEPMIALGKYRDMTWPDNWTSTTIDGKRTAQFEHTLLVTEDGVEILTARNKDSPGGPVTMPAEVQTVQTSS